MSRTNCNHGNRWRQTEGMVLGREEKWGEPNVKECEGGMEGNTSGK